MKKLISCILCLILACGMMSGAMAESTKEYRDDIYAFRYPASWNCDTASNGDIVLTSSDGKNAVLTFAIITDLWAFTGDAMTDAPMIENYISSYGGKNLALTGEYTLVQSGGLRGFRALGSWRASGQDAVMLVLSGDRHMVGFVLVGNAAIALEQDLLNSVELVDKASEESDEGFLRWESDTITLDYPSHFGLMEQTTGVVFVNSDDPNSIIMARVYNLDSDYTDAAAPNIASSTLPKSAKIEPNAEMIEIGGRNAAAITGTVSGSPVAYYVIGSGKTALALMFFGEESCSMAEHIIGSADIK